VRLGEPGARLDKLKKLIPRKPGFCLPGSGRQHYYRSVNRATILALFVTLLGHAADIKTVHFPSEDRHTNLVAYLFEPKGAGPHAAIVLLHGRPGLYSAQGVYDATTLSRHNKQWGDFWAEHGYYALLVDSFSARGFPAGFPPGRSDPPAEVSEQNVRPLDAYGALRYLRAQPGVIKDRIGVQGWSNGAMTVLAVMSDRAPGKLDSGFRAGLAEYPGCNMDILKGEYRSYAPVLVLIATDDEEVNPLTCEKFARGVKAAGSPLEMHIYPGAGHNYDDPEAKAHAVPGNRMATQDTFNRAEAFFGAQLKQ